MSKDMSNNSTNQREANCPIVGSRKKFLSIVISSISSCGNCGK